MTEQAISPTDAEQVILLRTANAQLRTRVGELEELKDSWRRVAERLEGELSSLRATISDLRTQRLRLERKSAAHLEQIEALTLALDEQAQQLAVMEASAAFQIGSGIINSARVSSNNAKPTITPLEETRGIVCPRCGNFLTPGISVVAGGASVCTSCLAPGETEIARARSL